MSTDAAHRLPPHSLEAEQGLLGSALIAPDSILPMVASALEATAFYFPAHQTLFAVLLDLQASGKPVELITITQALRDRAALEAVGGPAAVINLYTVVPTAANAAHYLEIVRDRWRLRKIITDATELASTAYDPGAAADEVETRLIALATDRAAKGMSGRKVKKMRELMVGAVQRLEQRFERRGKITGIPSGFPMLDRLTDGWKPGQMIVVGAREKQGKSSLVRQFAMAAADAGCRPFIASLEMSEEEVADAMLASESKIDTHSLTMNSASWPAHVFESITSAAMRLSRSDISILDEGDVTLPQLASAVRHAVLADSCKIAMIDYLQLLRSGKKVDPAHREQEVSSVGRGIKMMAKDLNIPIIVPIQLNDGGDARESKAIQMHCDKFLVVQHEDWENNPGGGKAWFRMKNQRGGGGRGAVPVLWRPEIMSFLPRQLEDGDATEPPSESTKKAEKSRRRFDR